MPEIQLPRSSLRDKWVDTYELSKTALKVATNDRIDRYIRRRPELYRPVSTTSSYIHYLIAPLAKRYMSIVGTEVGRLVGYVQIDGTIAYRINCCSSCYSGWITLDHHARSLQKRVLSSSLPQSDYDSSKLIMGAVAAEMAEAHGDEWGILTSTGYTAVQLAMYSMTIPGTVWLMDGASHNSMILSARASNPLEILKFSHNDYADLEHKIISIDFRYERLVVAIEGLYGMSGARPNLHELSRLKVKYGFYVFCDESHSAFSLDKEDLENIDVNQQNDLENVVDVRQSNMSKSIGTIGGYVGCKNMSFKGVIEEKAKYLASEGAEPTPLSSLIHTLYSLRTRQLLPPALRRLRHMTCYIQQQLTAAGFYVYATPGSPVMTIAIGRLIPMLRLLERCQKKGLSLAPVQQPAFPVAGVRLSITAALTNVDVREVVKTLVRSAEDLGNIPKYTSHIPDFDYNDVSLSDDYAMEQSVRTAAYISTSADLERAEDAWHKSGADSGNPYHDISIRRAGMQGLDTYGFGLSSARWINGTTFAHVELESYLGTLFGGMSVSLFNDTRNTAFGLAHALSKPTSSSSKHIIFLQSGSSNAITEGLMSASRNDLITVEEYDDIKKLRLQLYEVTQLRANRGITIIIDRAIQSADFSSTETITSLIQSLATLVKHGSVVRVVLNCQYETTFRGADGLGLLKNSVIFSLCRDTGIRLILYGSFYTNLKLPGAFVASDASQMDEIRWWAPTFFFSTSMPPLLVKMVEAAIRNGCAEA